MSQEATMADDKGDRELDIPADKLRRIQIEAENFKRARQQAVDAFGVLWSARLDLAIASGRADLLEQLIGESVGFLDNCNCNSCGGGTGGTGGHW
jgi:hypothetical protein